MKEGKKGKTEEKLTKLQENPKSAICIGDRLNVNSEQNMLNMNVNDVNKKFVKLYLQK